VYLAIAQLVERWTVVGRKPESHPSVTGSIPVRETLLSLLLFNPGGMNWNGDPGSGSVVSSILIEVTGSIPVSETFLSLLLLNLGGMNWNGGPGSGLGS
jgi:hypothetical protein